MVVSVKSFTWNNDKGGDWATAADWSPVSGPPGVSPGATDVANLIAGEHGLNKFVVTVGTGTTESFSVNTLNMAGDNNGHTAGLTIGQLGALTVGTLAYAGDSYGANVTINDCGILDITTAITTTANLAETITVQATGTGAPGTGGHLELGSLLVANANVAETFVNNGATSRNTGEIEFKSGFIIGSSITQTITNVAWGDEFVIDGANFTRDKATLDASKHVLTVVDSHNKLVFTMNGVTLQDGAANSFAVFGDVIQCVCYAAGTRILTATGERTVESLMQGDIVLTLAGGELIAQPVKWIGQRRIDLTAHPRPETVAPIRIRRGAFAEHMPHNDLLLSPDHAVFVDGKLICARQLVNGSTIRQEAGRTSVEYFHVELDTHAILLAEGLPAESYLNTGNRCFFANSGEPLVLHPDLTDETDYPAREAGSCAPFVSDEASVLPVWQRLAERAAALGQPAPRLDTTDDPELRIVAKGRTVRPLYGENGLYIFALPKGATEVRVISRAGAPTDARPWLDDRRCLGVNVERIVLRGANELREVPVDHPGLSQGWHEVERDGVALRRWTSGDAVLPLPVLSGPTMLEIRTGNGGMAYLTDADQERRAA